VLGVAADKVFMPPALMDDLYSGQVRMGGGPVTGHVDIRAERKDERANYLFQIQRIIQRLAPHIHHWNRSLLFSTEALRGDIGWAPEYTFPAAVEQTWQWMQAEGLDRTLDFDFMFEDELIERIEGG
jgi:hypothetical protein